MSATNNILHIISDHGNVIASKGVTYFGIASISVGGVSGAASGTVNKIIESQSFGLPDWAAVISIVGGLCLIIKNGVDTYYTIKDRQLNPPRRRKGDEGKK